ncbi:MAG: DNA primase [Bacteroidales bacterium]|nr:DNA primase [Bacteroidales bacterium]
MISQNTIQKIFEYSRIEEVVRDFVRLKKSGVNYKGLCPFHNEKTPSFMVNPAKNIFKCFGCGEAGNALSFIMKLEHFTYPEALRYLAEKYSINIEEDSNSEDVAAEMEEKESIYALNSFAQKYYTRMLHESEEGKAIAKTYLIARGFKKSDMDTFLLGYNPDVWDAFTQHAIENGFSINLLEKSGLTIFKDTNKIYDRFKGRIIFPIQNVSGRIIGFGARLIASEPNRPKYLNSPETEIYNKSKVLYGLNLAKSKIVNYDNCYLVEGYTDVIALHRAGVENVVSSSGTSLTKEQILMIKRYTQNITILYDGDKAGIMASLRGIDMILEEDMNVKIVSFPDGEDPDSFTQKNTDVVFRNYIHEHATDFIKFKTELLLKDVGNDPIKKTKVISDIVESIALIPDLIKRSVYIQECSSILDMSEQVLQKALSKTIHNKLKKQSGHDTVFQEEPVYQENKEQQILADTDDATTDEKELITFLLQFPNAILTFCKEEALHKPKSELRDDDKYALTVAAYIVQEITKDNLRFDNELYQTVFDEIAMLVAENKEINEHDFINHQDEKIRTLVIGLTVKVNEISKNWEEKFHIYVVNDKEKLFQIGPWLVQNFKSRKLFRLIKENGEKIKTAKDADEITRLINHHMKLQQIKNNLGDNLSRVFIKY